ncbi:uncharacterized protein VTP21DRAFT_5606 [Calcarisporiella thermophila]|uniref:uncharacterized protein n=1 Tax=Calcarisporiella thermophila TaxID=911321 RepID=UPI003742DCE6
MSTTVATTNDIVVEGGCLCKKIRYRAVLPPDFNQHEPSNSVYCLCTMCRKSAGALLATFFNAPVSRVQFIPEDATKRYTSSPGVHRHFCPDCGCQIYVWEEMASPELYGVTVATLDDPDKLPVGRAVFYDSGSSQLKSLISLDKSLPKWREGRRERVGKILLRRAVRPGLNLILDLTNVNHFRRRFQLSFPLCKGRVTLGVGTPGARICFVLGNTQ